MFAASKTDSASTGGYEISRSLRFNSADSAYLNRTPASASNQQTWTWSAWVKRSTISTLQTLFGTWSASTDAAAFGIIFGSDNTLSVIPWTNAIFTSTAVFRDPSAWYHIVVAFNSTQATASNRIIVYVNGVNQAGTYPLAVTQNANYAINSAQNHRLGDFPASGFNTFGGYMTEVNFIDGQALTPSSFGETNAQTGVWQPKAYSGSYGTNGFYLNFSDNSNTTAATLGKDYSGNGNNWTPNNFSVTAGAGNDSLVDSPTSYGTDTGVGGEVRGNYATCNPLEIGSATTLANGNLDVSMTGASGSSANVAFGTISVTSGKWYWEIVPTAATNGMIGVSDANTPASTRQWQGANFWGYWSGNGNKYNNNSGTAYGASYTTNDVIGVALDMDAGTVVFYKNGTSQGTAFSSFSGKTMQPALGDGGTTIGYNCNFGQRPFAYTAPSGFKALCTQNLPTPTIGATTATQASKFFAPVIYTPTSYPAVTTGVGFQPDFTWWKNRVRAEGHILWDVLRGSNLFLRSNTTAADDTQTNGWVANSDGWTSSSGSYTLNEAYVAWNWKANGSGSTNTAGSITSTVSANTTSGFSIVTYTGNGTGTASNGTVGHGLGVVPSMIIIKRRDNTGFWYVATKDGGTPTSPTYSVFTRGSSGLNQTGAAFATGQSYVSSGYISSTTFNLYWLNAAVTAGDSYDINYNTGTYVAYCFAEVAGYSKFGSYTGNGSANFIYTGFRPAYVLFRRTNSAAGWGIIDSSRNPYNSANIYLNANESSADGVGTAGSQYVDLLSNGFRCLDASGGFNASGDNYIYMAFASAPFKFSLAR